MKIILNCLFCNSSILYFMVCHVKEIAVYFFALDCEFTLQDMAQLRLFKLHIVSRGKRCVLSNAYH